MQCDISPNSFSFFRLAKADCLGEVFEAAQARVSAAWCWLESRDLAEIAILCAVEVGVAIVAIVDPHSDDKRFVGVDVVKSYGEVAGKFDAVIVTDVSSGRTSFDTAVEAYGSRPCSRTGGARSAAIEDGRGQGMSEAVSIRWYVVQTQVNGELKAAQNLMRQGFEVYLPCYLKRRRHARKIDLVSKPLFPRYLFVAIDVATQRAWRSPIDLWRDTPRQQWR